MSGLPDRGELAQTSLARLLTDLQAQRFSGALVLERGRVRKSFLFHKGDPLHVESSLASESLDARVAEVEKQAPGDRRKLLDALKGRVRQSLLECFAWPDGSFALDREARAPKGSEALRSDGYALVQEGIEAHWSPDRVFADLGPRMSEHPTPTQGLAQVATRLRRDEAVDALFAALDGQKTLWQILREAPTPRALAAAWVLDASGVLAYAATGGSGAEPAAPQVEIVVARAASPAAERPRAAAREAARPERAAAAEKLARAIEEQFQRIEEANCYELLGVPPDADASAIKKAYLAAARAYHPDVVSRAGLDAETRTRANKVFGEITKAHAILVDPEQRREYDESLAGGGDRVDLERLASAEGLFVKGEVLLRQGNFRGALEFLAPAVELWPDEAAYQAALGWALYKKAPSEPKSAREHLERAVELDPQDGVAMYRLSVVLRALGEDERSAKTLARAKSLGGGEA